MLVGAAMGTLLVSASALVIYATSMPVNHVATVQLTIAAPPDVVAARVGDWRSTGDWKHDVTSIEDLGIVDGQQRYRECTSDCLDIAIEQRGNPLVSRIVDHPDFGGTWTWTFSPIPGGTLVTLTEAGEVYNPMFRVVMHYLLGEDANIKATSQALAASFES